MIKLTENQIETITDLATEIDSLHCDLDIAIDYVAEIKKDMKDLDDEDEIAEAKQNLADAEKDAAAAAELLLETLQKLQAKTEAAISRMKQAA